MSLFCKISGIYQTIIEQKEHNPIGDDIGYNGSSKQLECTSEGLLGRESRAFKTDKGEHLINDKMHHKANRRAGSSSIPDNNRRMPEGKIHHRSPYQCHGNTMKDTPV